MSTHRVFELCGLRIRSAIDLHLPEAAGDGWDVDVEWGSEIRDSKTPPDGEVVAEHDLRDQEWWYRAVATDTGYCLRFRDCGEFLVSSDLTNVVVRADPTGRVALLPILMAGTVGAFILTLRGATVLHASAVSIDGVALAFV